MFFIDDLLVNLPKKGLFNIFEKIYEMVQEDLNDVSKIKDELLQIQTLYEFEELSEEEYQEREAELLERLTRAIEDESADE